MENWQKSRNYRRVKDESGNIIANIITVDGVDVEVTEEVFLAYSQADRRERYIVEEVEPGKILSLDKLMEDEVPLSALGIEEEPSVESVLLDREASIERAQSRKYLTSILTLLRTDDQKLIQALYFNNLSAREYARQIGTTHRAVIKRRDRILRDIRKIFRKISN